MPNDPKFKTIARVSKQPIAVVLGVYVHLLVSASAAVDRGTLDGYNVEDLATALDVDSASVGAILDAMQGRVLEGDKVSGWDKRQVNREDSSTERMRQFRNRKVTHSDARVTHGDAMKRNVTADKSREEEIKKEQKPSRDKREVDPRHVVFKEEIERYTAAKGVLFVWDVAEASQLSLLLKAVPQLAFEDFKRCLMNRARSPGTAHGERPRVWLPHILKYQEAPLNEFGKTGIGNGNRNSKTGGNITAAAGAFAILEQAERNSNPANEVQPETGSRGKPGDLSHLRAGSIEL